MLALLVAVSLAVPPAPADAAGADERAKVIFDSATKLYGQRRYAEAIVKFQEAYSVAPLPLILYNIGKCHNRLGDPSMALRNFREYQRLDPSALGDAAVKGEIAKCEKRLKERGVQQLLVFANPASARIVLDGKPLSPSPAYVEVKPGAHTLRVSAEGYQSEESELLVEPHHVSETTVSLRSQSAEPLATAGDDAPTRTQNTDPSLTPSSVDTPVVVTQAPTVRPRVATWVTAGVAVAAAATAGGLGLAYSSANHQLKTLEPNRTQAQADALVARVQGTALGADIALGVAGAAAVTAIVLFFVEGAPKQTP